MEIQLHGQYTEQDIRRGLALMRGRAFQILGIVVGIVVTLGMLPTVISILSGEAEAIDVLSIILPALDDPCLPCPDCTRGHPVGRVSLKMD
jgi:hypothetical protein